MMNWHDTCPCRGYPKGEEIIDGIFVGNWDAANDSTWLQQNNIKHMLTIADRVLHEVPDFIDVHEAFVMDDNGEMLNRKSYIDIIPLCMETILNAVSKGERILVHCVCGMNRSVSTVICYLMRHKDYSWEQAKELLSKKRSIASPSDALRRKINKFLCDEFNNSKR